MNKRDARKYEKLLEKLRAQLLIGIEVLERDNLEATVENGGDPTSYAEVGTDNFERETALNIASGESARLREVNEALRRIGEGSYGDCEGCTKPIDKKRLEALPSARYCLGCQAKLERDGYI